jgi:cytochrome b561
MERPRGQCAMLGLLDRPTELISSQMKHVVALGMLWRTTRGRRLPSLNRGALHLTAVATHQLLDLLLLIMVALGITDVFAHGFPLFNLWHFPKFGSDEFLRSVNAWHGLTANIIIAVVLFHSAAALFHHHVIKDSVLRRMWPTSTEP